MAVKGLAPPPQSPDTRSTPTHPPGASETTLTMPNTAPSPPLAQATKKRKAFKRFRIIYWTMALAVLLISILATIDDFQRTTYYVADINHRVLNPYEIKVSWTVHNTGMRAGTPNCEIHASSPGDEDAGFDTAPGTKPIPAGGQHTAFTTLTISNHGAEHVTERRRKEIAPRFRPSELRDIRCPMAFEQASVSTDAGGHTERSSSFREQSDFISVATRLQTVRIHHSH